MQPTLAFSNGCFSPDIFCKLHICGKATTHHPVLRRWCGPRGCGGRLVQRMDELRGTCRQNFWQDAQDSPPGSAPTTYTHAYTHTRIALHHITLQYIHGPRDVHTYMHAYIHTCMHAYMHASHVHTSIHTHIYTYTQACVTSMHTNNQRHIPECLHRIHSFNKKI